jgi:hypothetical protein
MFGQPQVIEGDSDEMLSGFFKQIFGLFLMCAIVGKRKKTIVRLSQ